MVIAGIVAASFFCFPSNILLYTIAVISILAIVLHKRLLLKHIFLCVSVFLLGSYAYNNAIEEYTIGDESKQNFYAVITSLPTERGKVLRCTIVVVSGKMAGKKLQASILRDTIQDKYQMLRLGSSIYCNAFVDPPKDFHDTHFSYSRYMMSNGISGSAFIPLNHWNPCEDRISSLSNFERLRIAAIQYRETLISRYRQSGLGDISLSLVSAMTLGDRSMISKEVRNDFSVTGTSHVLAMSGLHLSILYMFLTVAWGKRKRWIFVSLANIILIWAFVFIAGLPLSLVRSAIMLSAHCLLSVVRRDSLPLNTLSLAALIIIAANPLSVYDVGFQMSFSAVLAILLVVPFAKRILSECRFFYYPLIRILFSFILISCISQIAVAPLIAYYFGSLSCYFLIANAVAIPCTYLILVLGMLLLIVPIAFFQGIIASILNAVARFLYDSLSFIASLPCSSINVEISAMAVVLIYLFIAILFFLAYKRYAFCQRKICFLPNKHILL